MAKGARSSANRSDRSHARISTLPRDPDAEAVDPNHHLWRNGRLWWIAFTVHRGHVQERVRFSLGTDDVVEARRRRDRVFAVYEEAQSCRISLRLRKPRLGTSPARPRTCGGESPLTPDADRRSPSWCQPLAPVAGWLESVDQLIEESRRPRPTVYDPESAFVDTSRPRVAPLNLEFGLPGRARWMRERRKRYRLDARDVAQRLGYMNPSDILNVEAGLPVPRNPIRQRAQVAALDPDAEADPLGWIREWRRRLGVSGYVAAKWGGYRNRREFYRAEKGFFRPSWEKLLIAMLE